MRRGRTAGRGVLLAAVVAATCTAALSSPSSASAFINPAGDWPAIANPSYWPSVFSGGHVPGQLSIPDLTLAEDGICGVAAVECVGAIALVAGGVIAGTAVWKSGLGSAFGTMLWNLDSNQTSANLLGERLCPFIQTTWGGASGSFTINACDSNLGDTGGTYLQTHPYDPATILPVAGNGFSIEFRGSSCNYGGGTIQNSMMIIDPSAYTGGGSGPIACATQAFGMLHAFADSVALTFTNSQKVDGSNTCKTAAQGMIGAGTYTGSCTYLYVPESSVAQEMGTSSVTPCGGTGQVACPTSPTWTFGTSTGAGCGGTSTVCQAAENKADSGPESSAETPVDCYVANNCTTTPTTVTPTTVTVPTPRSHELAADYEADVLAAGLTYTVHVITTADPAFGPNEVTDTTPSPASTVQTGTQVKIQENPTTANCPAGDTTCGGVLSSGGGACALTTPTVNFSPLTTSTAPSKFPFGLFAWVSSGLSGVSSSTAAPSFDLPVMGHLFGTDSMHVDMGFLDPFAVLFRTALLITCTFGFVWWLSTAFLGLSSSGGDEPAL